MVGVRSLAAALLPEVWLVQGLLRSSKAVRILKLRLVFMIGRPTGVQDLGPPRSKPSRKAFRQFRSSGNDKPRCAASSRLGRKPALSYALGLGSLLLIAPGCAIHYYDPDTKTEHLWGVGHMMMRFVPPSEGVQAVVRGTDVLGASIGNADGQAYLTVGWHSLRRLETLSEDLSIRLEWPNSDFACVRLGSEFPAEPPWADLACPKNAGASISPGQTAEKIR